MTKFKFNILFQKIQIFNKYYTLLVQKFANNNLQKIFILL